MPQSTRRLACRLAAEVMTGRPDSSLLPTLWSLAVFFENYIDEGAERTRREFGPKKPRRLKQIK